MPLLRSFNSRVGLPYWQLGQRPRQAPSRARLQTEAGGRSSGDIFDGFAGHATPRSTRASMSSARQTVILEESFNGLGNSPVLHPAHHFDRLTGIGPRGARMDDNRTKPV